MDCGSCMIGGKVLGQGGYGCVIKPAIMCKTDMDPKNKVSKIMRMDKLDEEEKEELIVEYEISKKFKKIDKNNKYFLGGIDKCTFKNSKISKKDLKGCNFPHKKEIDIMNIVMTIGEDFNKIAKKLDTEDLLKCLAHLLIGARKSIIDLNVALLDIKYENLLFVRDDKNKNLINPVFIDFSPLLVPQSKTDFLFFIKAVGMQYYPFWPLEVLLYVFSSDPRRIKKLPKLPKESDSEKIKKKYDKIEMDNIVLQNDIEDFNEPLKQINNYDVTKQNYKKFVNEYKRALKKDYKKLMGKSMVYQLGNCFPHLKNKDEKFNNIIKKMTEQDYKKRLDIDGTLKEIVKEIGKINNKKLLIDYKKYSKLNRMKKLFKSFFVKQKFSPLILKKKNRRRRRRKNKIHP